MKRGSTLFLKAIIVLIATAVLAFCIFILPQGLATTTSWNGYRPIIVAMYISAIPFFIALYQAWKLLVYIDQNKAFSKNSLKALNIIKYCGIVIGTMYTLGLPHIFIVADYDDAPGVMLIGLIFAFGPLIIAVFAAILQKMFQNAMHIKSENDLII